MHKIYIFILLITLHISAHQLKENYLTIAHNTNTQDLNITFKIETRLFELHYPIDDNNNSIVSHKELYNNSAILMKAITQKIEFLHQNSLLDLADSNIVFYRNQDQTYMRMTKLFKQIDLTKLSLEYNLFFEYENDHKLLIHLDKLRGDYTLNHTQKTYNFSSYKMSYTEQFFIYFKNGFYHLTQGFDHLLFLLMLLLATHIREIKDILNKRKIISLLKLITIFSIAHSITLFISISDIYTPNMAFIEASIALSIIIAAGINISDKLHTINYYVVFSFGLLHGFGFANVLNMLDITDSKSFIVSLLGFNIGIEIAQIIVLFLTIPLLLIFLHHNYKKFAVQLISIVTIFISLTWFIERVNLF